MCALLPSREATRDLDDNTADVVNPRRACARVTVVALSVCRGVGQASRASIIAESAQRRQYVFPLTRFAAWYRVSEDFANLSKFSSFS